MSCKNCDNSTDGIGIKSGYTETAVYYYRFKNANIAVIGCEQHVKELFSFLNGEKRVTVADVKRDLADMGCIPPIQE